MGYTPDNLEAHRFAVDYRKLNVITKYPRYPLPLIDDLIMNIPHTGIMSALNLRSGYFQLAVNPSDIVKTAFLSRKMSPTLSAECHLACQGGSQFSESNSYNSQTRDREVCECLYVDDVIISSPSFTQHVEHLKDVFRLLHDAGYH
ncbi:transposon Ty3-I Gag-Pol polyprotein [Trichonephila clavipes]|nr:transposon Ty3-I Gag-Pol polyprotein [Trichonephila clavipes]